MKKENILIIMVGIPGSGKSTFIKQLYPCGMDRVVSRDEIRFSLLTENEPYFSKETEVKKRFIWALNHPHGGRTFADATHISRKSRKMLLNSIDQKQYDRIACIYIKTPLETAIAQNAMRQGRALVPEDAIKNMYNSLEEPSLDEGFDIIYTVDVANDTIYWEEKEKYE